MSLSRRELDELMNSINQESSSSWGFAKKKRRRMTDEEVTEDDAEAELFGRYESAEDADVEIDPDGKTADGTTSSEYRLFEDSDEDEEDEDEEGEDEEEDEEDEDEEEDEEDLEESINRILGVNYDEEDDDLEEDADGIPQGDEGDELEDVDQDDPEVTESVAYAIKHGIIDMRELAREFPQLAENVQRRIVKVTKKSRLQSLVKSTALQMAKERKDPDYAKYAKARKLMRTLRNKIYAKYSNKSTKKAKQILNQLNKGGTVRLK